MLCVPECNQQHFAQCLTLRGCSVNTYIDCYTPLLHAIHNGDAVCVRNLVAIGADVNLTSKGGITPLYKSLEVPQETGITHILVEAGADVNEEYPTGDTPLIDALYYHTDLLAKFLLAHSPDVNKVSRNGDTALYVAVSHGMESVVKLLLEAGALPDVVVHRGLYCGTYGDNALCNALAKGLLPIADLLLAAHADINLPSARGTPLVISAYVGVPEQTQQLLRMNAQVNVKRDTTLKDIVTGYHLVRCVPICYMLLYIAGEKLNYFQSLDFVKEFIDLGCEWFLREVFLPGDILRDDIKRFLGTYKYMREGDMMHRAVQDDTDKQRCVQFFEYIHENNFTLKGITRQCIRKYLLATMSCNNLFTQVAELVVTEQIPKVLGEYLLYGFCLAENVVNMYNVCSNRVNDV